MFQGGEQFPSTYKLVIIPSSLCPPPLPWAPPTIPTQILWESSTSFQIIVDFVSYGFPFLRSPVLLVGALRCLLSREQLAHFLNKCMHEWESGQKMPKEHPAPYLPACVSLGKPKTTDSVSLTYIFQGKEELRTAKNFYPHPNWPLPCNCPRIMPLNSELSHCSLRNVYTHQLKCKYTLASMNVRFRLYLRRAVSPMRDTAPCNLQWQIKYRNPG